MRFLRWLAGLVVVLGLLVAGAEYALTRWARAALLGDPNGPVQATAVRMEGVPLRLGLSATALSMAHDDRVASLPELSATAPLWDPLALALTPAFPLEFGEGDVHGTLSALSGPATLAFGYAPDLPLRATTVVLTQPKLAFEGVTLPGGLPATLDAATAQFSMTRAPQGGYDTALTLAGLNLPQGLADAIAPGTGLADHVESLTFAGNLAFDPPPSARGPHPQLDALKIDGLSLLWDGHDLLAQGAITLDPAGVPHGRIEITTHDWRGWLEIARKAGWLGRAEHLVSSLVEAMAAGSKDGALTLPLIFDKGEMRLGPVPLGPAPHLR